MKEIALYHKLRKVSFKSKIYFLLIMFNFSFLSASHAGELAVSSIPEQIYITLKYAGEKITLFGESEEGAHIIVKMTSMEDEKLKLSKKGKRGIFWINVKSLEIVNVPSIYLVHTSGKMSDIPKDIQRRIGADKDYSTVKSMARTNPEDPETKIFIDGYVKLKEEQGLYAIREDSVKIIKGRLFKSEFFMPSHVPVGSYRVDSYAVKENTLIASGSAEIKLGKVGIESWVTDLAMENGLFYGIMSVMIALLAGIGVGFIFKGGPSH